MPAGLDRIRIFCVDACRDTFVEGDRLIHFVIFSILRNVENRGVTGFIPRGYPKPLTFAIARSIYMG